MAFYPMQGYGAYQVTNVRSLPSSYSGFGAIDCDIAAQFDPDYIAGLINKQLAGNNAAGKESTYYIVAALWRLGYSKAGFDMTATPKGYVSWAEPQGAMWNAWRTKRLGSKSPNGIFPTSGTKADLAALQAMKADLLAVQGGGAVPGPFDPKIVCVRGSGGSTTYEELADQTGAKKASMWLLVGGGVVLAAAAGVLLFAKKKPVTAVPNRRRRSRRRARGYAF